jgi:hypothetical protein
MKIHLGAELLKGSPEIVIRDEHIGLTKWLKKYSFVTAKDDPSVVVCTYSLSPSLKKTLGLGWGLCIIFWECDDVADVDLVKRSVPGEDGFGRYVMTNDLLGVLGRGLSPST